MTTLEQLLDNFAEAAIDYSQCGPNGGLREALKAAQEAIVAHVEGAMGNALVFGKRNGCSYGVGPLTDAQQRKWNIVVKEWTE